MVLLPQVVHQDPGPLLAYPSTAREIRPQLEVWILSRHTPIFQCVALERGEHVCSKLPPRPCNAETSTASRDGSWTRLIAEGSVFGVGLTLR